jgi:hypothetical protein
MSLAPTDIGADGTTGGADLGILLSAWTGVSATVTRAAGERPCKETADGSAVWAVDRSVTQGDEWMSSMWRKRVAGVMVSASVLAVAAPVEAQVVRAWGRNDYGQCNVPGDLGPTTAIAGGERHTIVLRTDGTVRCWGWNGYGQCNVPIPSACGLTRPKTNTARRSAELRKGYEGPSGHANAEGGVVLARRCHGATCTPI